MHILIVDDDPMVHRALLRAIERVGYTADRGHRISCAESGDVCRRIVAEESVDVIFMDGELGPGDTGPVVVSQLREAGCRARIVMTSSLPELSDVGIEAGADAKCDKTNLGADPEATLAQLGIPPP